MNPLAAPCPDCQAELPPDAPHCPMCGLPLLGPVGRQLGEVDRQLAQLDEDRSQLLMRREGLIVELRARRSRDRARATIMASAREAAPNPPPVRDRPSPAPPPAEAAPPADPVTQAASPPPAAKPRREFSARSVQNLLLGLGGTLLAIAAVVFTVVSWGYLNIAGKAAILATATAVVAYLPRPLHRRGLAATAETFAALAFIMLCLDAFALWSIAGGGLDSAGYWAAALTAITALTAGYSRLMPVRAPGVLALLAAQPAPLLMAAALQAPVAGWSFALLATAAGNAVAFKLAWGSRVLSTAPQREANPPGSTVLRGCALVLFLAAGGAAVAITWVYSVLSAVFTGGHQAAGTSATDALGLAAVLALAGGLALYDTLVGRPASGKRFGTAAATLLWITVAPAALGGWAPNPVWAVLGLAVSAALATAVALVLPRARRDAVGAAVAIVSVPTTLVALPAGIALADYLLPLTQPWQGQPEGLASGFRTSERFLGLTLTAVFSGVAWTGCTALFRRALAVHVGLTACGGGALLLSALLPEAFTLGSLVATAAGFTAVAVIASTPRGTPSDGRRWRVGNTALGLAGILAAFAASAALSGPVGTIAVLAALLACAVAGALPSSGAVVRCALAAAAVLGTTGLVVAAFAYLNAAALALCLMALSVAALAVAVATVLSRLAVRPDQVRALDAAALVPMVLATALAAAGGRALVSLTVGLGALLLVAVATHYPSLRRRFTEGAALLALTAVLPVIDRLAVTLASGLSFPLWGAVASSAGEAAAAAGTLPLLSAPPDLPLLLPAYAVAAVVAVLAAGLARGPRAGAATAIAAGTALAPLFLSHLPVPYDAAAAALTAASGGLLLAAARSWPRMRPPNRAVAVTALWSGVALAVLTAGWTATSLARTVLVLGALSGFAVLGALICGPRRDRAGRHVSATLACVSVIGVGVNALAVYCALHAAGAPVETRWWPFAALAVAAAALGTGRLRVLHARPEQRGGLAVGAILLAAIAVLVGIAATGIAGLVVTGGACVAAGAGLSLHRTARLAVGSAAAVGLAAAVATAAVPFFTAATGGYLWIGAVWSGLGPEGAATAARAALPSGTVRTAPATMLAPVLAGAALAVLLLVWLWLTRSSPPMVRTVPTGEQRRILARAALVAAAPVLLTCPVVLDLPYALALGWLLAVVTAYAAAGALSRDHRTAILAGALALWPGSLAAAWGLAERPATLMVLGLLTVIAATGPALGRTVAFTAGASAAATLLAGAFAATLLMAGGQPAAVAALAVVAVVVGVAAAVALLERSTARATRRSAAGTARTVQAPAIPLAAEAAAGVLAVAALAMSMSDPARLQLGSVVLAVLGVTALASAPRRDRRWLGAVGAVLLLGALWVLLFWLDVAAPEPYLTLPALAALAVGWEWRRRRAGIGSWAAYAPGLALGLAPSLLMTYLVEDGALRPALLGAAALAVTLAGARRRLQAPLLVGGAALLLVAGKAFGAPLWDFIVTQPRWVPVGVAGVLLMVVGARYEQRLRDLRRLGRAFKEMG